MSKTAKFSCDVFLKCGKYTHAKLINDEYSCISSQKSAFLPLVIQIYTNL